MAGSEGRSARWLRRAGDGPVAAVRPDEGDDPVAGDDRRSADHPCDAASPAPHRRAAGREAAGKLGEDAVAGPGPEYPLAVRAHGRGVAPGSRSEGGEPGL